MTHPGTSPDADPGAASAPGGCGCHGDSEAKPADLGQPTVGEPSTDDQSGSSEAPKDSDSTQESGSGCCGGHGAGRSTQATDSQSDAAKADAAAVEDADNADDVDAEDAPSAPTVEEQLAEAIDTQQRLAAEFANFRRRTERDRAAMGVTAKADVFAELLPVLDDLDLAKQHGDLSGPLKAVNDKLRAAFTKHNVTQFGSEGDEFNPDLHEAVQDSSTSENKVLGAVLRPGFMIGDRLIRTAMVTIADAE